MRHIRFELYVFILPIPDIKVKDRKTHHTQTFKILKQKNFKQISIVESSILNQSNKEIIELLNISELRVTESFALSCYRFILGQNTDTCHAVLI